MKCVVPTVTLAMHSAETWGFSKTRLRAVSIPVVISGVVGVLQNAITPLFSLVCEATSTATASVFVPNYKTRGSTVVLVAIARRYPGITSNVNPDPEHSRLHATIITDLEYTSHFQVKEL
jgi:hypothetical protein